MATPAAHEITRLRHELDGLLGRLGPQGGPLTTEQQSRLRLLLEQLCTRTTDCPRPTFRPVNEVMRATVAFGEGRTGAAVNALPEAARRRLHQAAARFFFRKTRYQALAKLANMGLRPERAEEVLQDAYLATLSNLPRKKNVLAVFWCAMKKRASDAIKIDGRHARRVAALAREVAVHRDQPPRGGANESAVVETIDASRASDPGGMAPPVRGGRSGRSGSSGATRKRPSGKA